MSDCGAHAGQKKIVLYNAPCSMSKVAGVALPTNLAIDKALWMIVSGEMSTHDDVQCNERFLHT